MRTLNFAKRNTKEIIRDPLSTIFAIILPLFLLFIFQQFKIPSDNYKIENFTPGVIIFSNAFLTLFTAMLVSSDRNTSLLIRLKVSPMTSTNYILGYILSLIPVIVIQNILLFTLAIILGLNISINLLLVIPLSIIISILFIVIGIIIGSIFTEKASSGISSIILQLVIFTSTMYFPKELLGNFFTKLCNILPFESALQIIKNIMNNNINAISTKNMIIFSLYLLITTIISIIIFNKNMLNNQN